MVKHITPRGFTLVELVVVMAIVAILVTVGIPGFNNIIRDNRLITSTNELVGSMALARSEAVKRGIPVTVCASSDGTACTASDWDEGWIVFTDQGTAMTVDGTDDILRVQNRLSGDVNVAVGGNTEVRYAPSGFLAAAGTLENPSVFAAIHEPKSLHRPLGQVVAKLLPGSTAQASGNGNNESEWKNGGKSGNDNLGTGNSGNGYGNTGTGNQGNESQVGNAGGGPIGSGGGGGGGGGIAAAQSTFTFCDGRTGENGRQVTILASGRIASQTISCQ